MHRRMLFSFVMILFFFGSFSSGSAAQSKWSPNNWSVVVTSCDKYSALWDPFFKALEHHWPELNSSNRNVEIYLVANTKQYDSSRVKTIHIPDEKSWSDNMLSALEKIDSKYIVLFLEDYWVTKLDQKRLMELMQRVEREDAAYMELWEGDADRYGKCQSLDKIEGVVYKGKFQRYRASLQLALWEKKALQQLLRSGESIWDFELAASIRSSGYPKPFLALTANPPITYLNAVYQGHITPSALEFDQEQSINLTNTMPVLKKYNWDLTWQTVKRRIRKGLALFKKEDDRPYYYFFND